MLKVFNKIDFKLTIPDFYVPRGINKEYYQRVFVKFCLEPIRQDLTSFYCVIFHMLFQNLFAKKGQVIVMYC